MFIDPRLAHHAAEALPHASPGFGRVIALVSREMDVPKSLLLHHSRCRAGAARARQVAMYLSHVALGQSLTSVGHAFHRDRTTVGIIYLTYQSDKASDSADRPALTDVVGITPEMIEAGFSAFVDTAECELVERPNERRVQLAISRAFSAMLVLARR